MSEAEKNLTVGPGAPGQPQTNPGDEAPPGTVGTGEDICRHCGGSGRHDGKPCPECGGTGKVVEGIGGG
jgi:DnaJ-class molecular chaperone